MSNNDLNLGGGTNVVSFTTVTDIVSDSRYTAGGSGEGLEAPPVESRGKAQNGLKHSRNLHFDNFFQIVHRSLLTKTA